MRNKNSSNVSLSNYDDSFFVNLVNKMQFSLTQLNNFTVEFDQLVILRKNTLFNISKMIHWATCNESRYSQ